MKTRSSLHFVKVAASVVLLSVPSANAAWYYWDTNGGTSGLGNTAGTWGSSSFLVSFGAGNRGIYTGTINPGSGPTGANDFISFGSINMALGSTASTIGTTGTLNINTIISALGQGSQGVTVNSGGTINLAGTSPTIYSLNTGTNTIGANLSGTAGMTAGGSGTLTLTNASNSLTGTVAVTGGGRLNLGDGTTGGFTATTNGLTFNAGGGTFNLATASGGSQTMGALSFSAGDGTVISTAASGAATQTLTLDSFNARTAGATGNFELATNTTAADNQIVLTSATNAPVDDSGSSDPGVFFGGSEYARYDTTNNYFRAVTYGTDTNAAALVSGTDIGATSSATDVKLSGAITGQTAASVNTINLGANNFTFDNAGVSLGVNGILSAGSGSATISNGTNASSIQTTGSAGELVVRVNGSSDALSIAPSIVDNVGSSLTKSGAGSLTLSGTNTYTGVTTINSGTLIVSGGSAIDDTSTVVLGNAAGANLQLNSSETIGNLTGGGFSGGNVDVQGNTLTIADSSGTFGGTFTGTGSGAITKQGAGTLVLTNQNTFPGTLTLGGGALQFDLGNSQTTNGQSLSSGGAINMAGGTTMFLAPTPQVALGQPNNNTPISQLTTNPGWTIDNDINITSGTADFRFTGNGSHWEFTGDVTGGTSGNQTLNILQGTPAGGSGDIQAILYSGVIQDGSGGTLGVSADFTASSSPTGQSAFINLSGSNTFTGDLTVTNTRGLTNGGWLTIGGNRTATGTLTTGSGYLGGGNYAGNISLGNLTILDYASSANQTLAGVISGAGVIQKDGAGTLTLTNGSNSFAGAIVNSGTLQLSPNYVGAVALNGGTLAVNLSGTPTQGVDIPAIIGGNANGSGGLENIGSGTLTLNAPTHHTGTTKATSGGITLSHALALQNSALDTSGAGTVTLSGVTTPTFGGLTGSADLSSYLVNYSGVTALTLNPQTGNSHIYTGAIANGSGAMTLTKNGGGTQILRGANTYSGATTINEGTLTLSGASGAIDSTSIVLNGGGLTLDNNSSTGNLGTRISDSASVTVNGTSALTFSHNGASGVDYSETIDILDLQLGNLTYTGSQANSSGPRSSNFQFNTLSRTGASNTSTANFAGTGLGTNVRNTIKFGAGVTDGVDLGPWAVVNATDFATYDATLGVKPASNTTLVAGSNSATTNFRMTGGGVTITAATNPSYKTLLVSDTTARTLAINGNTVSMGGVSSIGQNHIISGTGAVQALAAGDALYINVGSASSNNTLAVNSIIQNVGAGVTASSLVKHGVGTLVLGNASNSYSGGTVINAGTVQIAGDGNLGASGAGLTFNGNATLSNSTGTTLVDLGSRPIVLNNGAIATFLGASRPNTTVGGAVTGSGGVTTGPASFWSKLSFDSTSNTFSGAITDGRGGNDGINNALFRFNSIADGAGYGNIILNGGDNSGIDYGPGAIAPLNLNNRQLVLANGNTVFFNNMSSQAVNINTDIAFSGTGNRQIRFGISGASNHTPGSGINTFSGKLTDSPGGIFSPTVNGGTWAFTGANTYSGNTTLSGGTLNINNASAIGTGTFIIGGNTTFDNTSGGPITLSTNTPIALRGGNPTFTGTQDLNMGTGAVTLSGANRTITVSNSGATLTLGGGITTDNNGNRSLTKSGAGTLALDGAAGTWSGGVNIQQGTLSVGNAAALGTGPISFNNSANGGTLRNTTGSLITDNVAVSLGGNAGVTATITGTAGNDWSFGKLTNIQSGNAVLMVDTVNATFTDADLSNSGTSRTLVVDGTGNVNFTGTVANGSSSTASALTKQGAGTLTLSGTGTYDGATTVSDGKLFVNGDSSTATGAVSVNALATLGGTGIIGGSTTVADTGKLEFDISTAPGSHDGLALASGQTLSFGANATLTINSISGATTGSYILVTAPGGVGALPTFTLNLPVGWSANVTRENSDTELVLNVTSIGATSPYDEWADGFTPNPGANNLNPDTDAFSNLLEFAFGTNPNVSDAVSLTWNGSTFTPGSPVIVGPTYSESGVEFKVRFIRRLDHGDPGSADYAWQFSSNLSTWESSDDSPAPDWLETPAQLATQGDYELLELDYPWFLDNNEKARFFRVEVTPVAP